MPLEIEHKYLVKTDLWKKVTPEKSIEIKQAYLLTDPAKTIRIRTAGEKGFMTIKGKTVNAGRPEFEYEIPYADSIDLIRNFCSEPIEKIRHYVTVESKVWEVDEFQGLNVGLVIAEIELQSETEEYKKPEWVDKDVTQDARYANSNLSKKPFTTW